MFNTMSSMFQLYYSGNMLHFMIIYYQMRQSLAGFFYC